MKFQQPLNRPIPLGADPYLQPFAATLRRRRENAAAMAQRLTGGKGSLADFASGHEYYGLHRRADGWVFREHAPAAKRIVFVGDTNDWQERPEWELKPIGNGDWELTVPPEYLAHGQHYLLHMYWDGGYGERIPAYARYVVQDPQTARFSAKIWAPETPYCFRYPTPPAPAAPLIYESHVGMAQEEAKVGTFAEYTRQILPRIAEAGYNTVQLMALMSHPYYGSFGYHVANFFSIAGIFGTPDECKALVDEAHRLGLRVIMDLVHSHAVRNEVEGLGRFDGTRHLYFHEGARGEHTAWDSLCFNYADPAVLHFLLSNCRFWLDEYHLDGFRFDGVTSMLYFDHGLGRDFGSYEDYFNAGVDEESLTYLTLANEVIHAVRPDAMTVAEDVSGMPGLAAPLAEGGCGFDYRMAMGCTDMWFKLFDIADENWDMGWIYHELSAHRPDEKVVSYVECHDQSIVGGQTAIFQLAGAEMYYSMRKDSGNGTVDRAAALHKMIRLATLSAAGNGYLNFMGNEFGHPEWIDFPREGNNRSCHYARRQWSLTEDPDLRYGDLGKFDRVMLELLGTRQDFYRLRPQKMVCDNLAKILIFERDGLIFCFNFHHSNSVADYALEVPPGDYTGILNTDEARFGGFGRIVSGQTYFARRVEENGAPPRRMIRIYLPCRTALVLARLPRR